MKKSHPNLANIVRMLSDGDYHDGTSMGAALQMSRSAVWKTIKKLQQVGVCIDSVKGKGYALKEPLRLLEQKYIQTQLGNEDIDILLFESIDSTNAYFRAKKQHKKITFCLAELQTQGKGRMHRIWHSPFGKNIYLSCFYPFQKDISELAGLSLVMSLAIAKTLNSYCNKNNFSTKWPNDVVCDNQKISGSLIEIQAESHGLCHAIIGIGINVNMLNDDHQITQPWTSLQKITGQYVDRNELCVQLIRHVIDYLRKFVLFGFLSFKDEWLKTDCLMGKSITLHHIHKKMEGIVKGINEQGHLLMQLSDGHIQAFSSGDVSLNHLFSISRP